MSQIAFDSKSALGKSLSLVSSSGKRISPRVTFPLLVEFDDGARRRVGNWSVAGFSLADQSFASREGAVHRARLHLGLSDCDLTVEVDAKVSWLSDGHARGFRFIALPCEKARIIDHFIESGIDGDAVVVGGLPIGHSPAGLDRGRTDTRWRQIARSSTQSAKLLLLLGIVVTGSAFMLSRLLTVTTDYAAVAADLQQLHAPEGGYLRSTVIAVGTHLKAGQRIGLVQPVVTPQAQLSTETEIAALETALEQQNTAWEHSKAGFATFLQSSRTDLDEAVSGRGMLEQQVAAEDKVYQRTVALQTKGVVPEERMDQEQQVLLTLRRSLATALDAEVAMRQKLANAEAGRFSSDGRSTQKSPADLEQEMQATRSTIGRLKLMQAALEQPLPIVSPCDCTVAAVAATPGSYVASGASIADLAQDGGDRVAIDALVQNPRLNLLRQGQDVTVYLANRPDGIAGRVSAINFNPVNTGRTGLPASLRTLDDYGVMTVELADVSGRLPSGLPATVLAPVTWTALVANVPTLHWMQSAVDRVASLATELWSSRPTFNDPRADVKSKLARHDRPE